MPHGSPPAPAPIVLASRSPRRLELLSLLVPPARIVVCPPASSAEPGFEGLTTLPAIESQALSIAEAKRAAVAALRGPGFVLAADTVIVGGEVAQEGLVVLGQPPERPAGVEVVRGWFERFYFGRTHTALTAVAASSPAGMVRACAVRTQVTFSARHRDWLDWYLSSDEPWGKAGGYALQGLASLFVERVEGSLSNVVGLPLAETRELLKSLGALASAAR
ncbi:MAG: Maf family protein [Planctomyces sp.]|nr:Maf family protein [Planctomyces sp.]